MARAGLPDPSVERAWTPSALRTRLNSVAADRCDRTIPGLRRVVPLAGKRKTPKRRAVTTAAPVLDDLPELREARALWVRNDLFGALAKFERAVRDHPRHVRALADASRAYGAMYDFRRAEEMLERLVGLGRNNGHILHLAGQSYRLLRRPEAAMRCFREALAGRSPTSDSHLELGLLLERLNRLDEALDQAESRLRAQPKDPEGTFLKARIERRQGKFESASLALQSVTNTGSAHWLTRARAHAELAALFDERGAYAEAWEAMLAGKRVLAPYAKSAREHRERLVPALLKLTETVTREQLAAWREGPASESPRLALLTGLPRSGTTRGIPASPARCHVRRRPIHPLPPVGDRQFPPPVSAPRHRLRAPTR